MEHKPTCASLNFTLLSNPPQRAACDCGAESPLAKQVGGSHYKNHAIQPIEFIHANKIPFCEGNAIKYLCRWREKGGIAVLEKAKHYIELLIELEQKHATDAT